MKVQYTRSILAMAVFCALAATTTVAQAESLRRRATKLAMRTISGAWLWR